MRTIEYESGGQRLAIDIFQPDRVPTDQSHPGVLFFHGGGWRGGDRSQFHLQCERFAATGFVAATAQYRVGVSIAACVEDAVAALAELRATFESLSLDPQRVAVGGGSAGGHMALCLATCPDYVPSPPVMAVIAYNPTVDLEALRGGQSLPPAGVDRAAMSPIRHVATSNVPILIQHGTADQFFPIDVIRRFRDAANDCELVEYEGATHGFFNRRASEAHFEATTRTAIAFLTRVTARIH